MSRASASARQRDAPVRNMRFVLCYDRAR
jgi:hypothetical protein